MLRELLGSPVEACRKYKTGDLEVLTLHETEPAQLVIKRAYTWVLRQDADAIGASRLLRAHLQRPGQRCSAEQREEFAPPHDERAIAPILPLLHGVPPWINPRRNPTSELSTAVMNGCG